MEDMKQGGQTSANGKRTKRQRAKGKEKNRTCAVQVPNIHLGRTASHKHGPKEGRKKERQTDGYYSVTPETGTALRPLPPSLSPLSGLLSSLASHTYTRVTLCPMESSDSTARPRRHQSLSCTLSSGNPRQLMAHLFQQNS